MPPSRTRRACSGTRSTATWSSGPATGTRRFAGALGARDGRAAGARLRRFPHRGEQAPGMPVRAERGVVQRGGRLHPAGAGGAPRRGRGAGCGSAWSAGLPRESSRRTSIPAAFARYLDDGARGHVGARGRGREPRGAAAGRRDGPAGVARVTAPLSLAMRALRPELGEQGHRDERRQLILTDPEASMRLPISFELSLCTLRGETRAEAGGSLCRGKSVCPESLECTSA